MRVLLAGVVALALVKGLVWSVVLPPWYGPDEASHFAYVQELVEDHWLARGYDPNAALYYPRDIACSQINLGIGPISGAFNAEPPFGAPWVPCNAVSPADRHAASPSNPAGYSPLYYAPATPFYLVAQALSVENRLAAVRLWSVLLGMVAAGLAFLAARWAFRDNLALSVAAAVLFTLQPMNSQETAVVNNDALLIALAAAFWWRFYRILRHGLSIREAFILGGLAGLAYLAKPQGIFLAAAVPVAYLITLEKAPIGVRLKRTAQLAAAVALPVICAIAIGEVFSRLAGNGPLLPSATAGLHGIQQYMTVYRFARFERVYLLFITSFWGYFGWFQVDLPSYVYLIIALLVVLGVAGSLSLLRSTAQTRRLILASVVAVAVPLGLMMLLELYTFRITGVLILQGRSFLMLLIPLLVLLIKGWERILPRAARPGLAPSLVLLAMLLNLVSLAVMINNFYG